MSYISIALKQYPITHSLSTLSLRKEGSREQDMIYRKSVTDVYRDEYRNTDKGKWRSRARGRNAQLSRFKALTTIRTFRKMYNVAKAVSY